MDSQVIVIGAGVIGCSVAYHLARRGTTVTVIEANGVATGTSSATLGLVWVQRKAPAEYMELNLLSSMLHKKLVETYDEDVELNQPGGLSTYIDEAAYLKQLSIAEKLNADSPNHKTEVLSATQARQVEPDLSTDVIGALFSPYDGEINPMKLAFNLARNSRKLGVKFLTQCTMNQILSNDSGVLGVDTSTGVIRAGIVVVAAGVNTSRLIEPLCIMMPMVFERGQVLVTEPVRRVLTYPTGISRQTARGNILLGTTYEANCVERLTTAQAARKIVNDSIRRYPVLKDMQIIRHFAGIRPLPIDGLPYLGAVNRVPGLFVATSHSGITLAPVHGKVISELILDGETNIPIHSYRPERYMQ
ncbi:MAG: hypothetical protein A2136_10135 [Chloroflexi bacterium RBG_16_54_11]|nr:MAG: hypothetical protein A2136_10135 [Chloroflexi bacterium RBG_16_54_11]